jgi:2-methylaconitate cis-trans-isomerase PrpF
MSQYSIPCVVYRGGTSRGLFFHKKDLPENIEQRNRIFLHGIDAYNPSQVNGLGSGTSHTSKVVVIAPSSMEGVDVDYTFYQIGIGEEFVDDKGTCGNLMAAVGPFAVDEGLVPVDPSQDYAVVNVFNTNIGKQIKLQVPVVNGKAKVSGDFHMSGLVNPGAKMIIDILQPGGGKTGKTLPLDTRHTVNTSVKDYEVSFVDCVNPLIFLSGHEFGLKGSEPLTELSANPFLLEELDIIRNKMAVAAGMAETEQEAKTKSPSVPKIAIVAEPQDYITTSGKQIRKEQVDIVARMISMGKFHRTFAGSGLYCLAAAAMLPGTIPNQLVRRAGETEQTIRIGHPDGIVEIRVALTEDRQDIASVGLDRTARRIIKGDLFIPGQPARGDA